jgi:hypothetical protein
MTAEIEGMVNRRYLAEGLVIRYDYFCVLVNKKRIKLPAPAMRIGSNRYLYDREDVNKWLGTNPLNRKFAEESRPIFDNRMAQEWITQKLGPMADLARKHSGVKHGTTTVVRLEEIDVYTPMKSIPTHMSGRNHSFHSSFIWTY